MHGYYMYADGRSAWGIGCYRGKDKPVRISKQTHETQWLKDLIVANR